MEGIEAVGDAPASTPSAPATTTTTTSDPSSTASQPTTDRPSIKTALEVFHEAEKQQKRPRTSRSAITSTGEPAPPAEAAIAPEAMPAVQIPPANKQGPIPFEVHSTALANARAKERQAVEQEYAEIKKWATRAATDRVGFLRDVISEALQDPTLAPQIASLAGRTLGARPAPPSEHALPGPDFQDGQGNQFYSAKTMTHLLEAFKQQMRSEILGEVQPDLDQVRSEREQREIAHADHQRSTQITSHLAEAKKTWPHFEKFKTEIHAAVAAMPLTDGHPASELAVLQRAYWQVVGPKLSELEQARVVADLKSRANASSLNPAATAAPTGIPKNVSAKTGGTVAEALRWAATQTGGR